MAWAPGKGVKGKDLKDYWEGDLGVSYIPWSKIKPDIDLELLEDGGMVDEDTMPAWMQTKTANNNATNNAHLMATAPPVLDGGYLHHVGGNFILPFFFLGGFLTEV